MPKIDREPDYNNINTMMQILYGNAASLPTTLGGGQHGNLGIMMTLQSSRSRHHTNSCDWSIGGNPPDELPHS